MPTNSGVKKSFARISSVSPNVFTVLVRLSFNSQEKLNKSSRNCMSLGSRTRSVCVMHGHFCLLAERLYTPHAFSSIFFLIRDSHWQMYFSSFILVTVQQLLMTAIPIPEGFVRKSYKFTFVKTPQRASKANKCVVAVCLRRLGIYAVVRFGYMHDKIGFCDTKRPLFRLLT